MKIGLIVDIGNKKEKECLGIARQIEDVLRREGYEVSVTWPELGELAQRVRKVREAIREIP